MALRERVSGVSQRVLPWRLRRLWDILFQGDRRTSELELRVAAAEANLRGLFSHMLHLDAARRGASEPGDPRLTSFEARITSQNGEDGILHYLFRKIGIADKRAVEFGVEDGMECNSANLVVNMGWQALWFDGSSENVERGLRYYQKVLGEDAERLAFRQAFITAENIDGLIAEAGWSGDVDLLSIDIDGNDYWVWKAINSLRPRVVVVEYNAAFGPERALTVPYRADFRWRYNRFPDILYHGASLAALAKLGAQKGYFLAGCESCGVNAFFVRNDVGGGRVPEVKPADAWVRNANRASKLGSRECLDSLAGWPLVEI